MAKVIYIVFSLILTFLSVECGHTLHDSYPFSLSLSKEPSYIVHWKVDLGKETIKFAVNASSKGWVGFGLSKTGQMTGSDIWTGWVDASGQIQLQVSCFIFLWSVKK